MIRKAVIIASFATLGVILLLKSGILEAAVLFFLLGIIPGTNYSIPSSIMLLIIGGIVWLVLFRFTAIEAFHLIALRRLTRRYIERKKRLPKRRFGQI